ncbi:hypothetical protein Vadar_011501 [Vaccinium darrowii]|uniref:Uncharacterized protein n=1 Tax=Vaccinium darrowii TaxID=229202 RepID=A0ACB7WZP4_9ERIC|nr:hypothetical protein Vadar_011501 [Vaccinium darrowii]
MCFVWTLDKHFYELEGDAKLYLVIILLYAGLHIVSSMGNFGSEMCAEILHILIALLILLSLFLFPPTLLQLNHFLGAVTYPLSDGCFGPSTSELLEVIKIADHERRMEGHRLISVQNLLFGLSHSRVSDCVQEILNDRGMKPSTLATFGIYKLSRDAANLIGDAEVGLEHVVLAIFFGKQENIDAMTERSSLFFGDTWDAELLKCLRNSNTKCIASSLTESNVLDGFLPEDCRDGCNVTCEIGVLVTRLLEALDNDWNLLAIREATRRGYLQKKTRGSLREPCGLL